MTHEIVRCREPSCRALMVYLPTLNGASMPCDADTVGPDDRLYDKAKHISHFKTCKKPNRFGKGQRNE